MPTVCAVVVAQRRPFCARPVGRHRSSTTDRRGRDSWHITKGKNMIDLDTVMVEFESGNPPIR
jgi:hypothetical protein